MKKTISTNLREDGVLEIFIGDAILAEITDGEQTEEFIEEILNGVGYKWNNDGTITPTEFAIENYIHHIKEEQ